jgi:hypothetical protein
MFGLTHFKARLFLYSRLGDEAPGITSHKFAGWEGWFTPACFADLAAEFDQSLARVNRPSQPANLFHLEF